MNISITKKFKFEAAHQLPQHKGKCKNIHGHSYVLDVTVSGSIINTGPSKGMIMDFGDLSKIVQTEIIKQWDHQFLNEILPFTTTAENLAVECFTRLKNAHVSITKVRLWETAKCYAEVTI